MSVRIQSATAPGLTLSKDRCTPGSVDVPLAKWPRTADDVESQPEAIATKIVYAINSFIDKGDTNAVAHLFLEDGYWRDHLGLSWDIRTLKGRTAISNFLEGKSSSIRLEVDTTSTFRSPQYSALDGIGEVKGIQFYFNFKSKVGSGQGVARLAEVDGSWQIFTLFTSLRDITGHEEAVNTRRPKGVEHGGRFDRKNWQERRTVELNLEDKDPAVLVVGTVSEGPLHSIYGN